MFSEDTDTTTEASFVIFRNIAGSKRPCTASGFILKNLADVTAVLDPSNSRLQWLKL